MIQCKNCSFLVNDTMKFALMNNTCPSCGSGLFSEADKDFISLLQSKILSEKFSHRMTESQIYDIAVFIFNGLNNDLLELHKRYKLNDDSVQKNVVEFKEEENELDLDSDDIRREIAEEYSEKLNLLDDGDVMSDDVYTKVQKLKKLHKQRIETNPNLGKEVPIPTTKRNPGFKVNRSN